MLRRLFSYLSLTAFMILTLSVNSYALEDAVASANNSFILIASSVTITLTAIVGALAMSYAIHSGLTGMSRNPAAGDKIATSLIIGLALIEALVIYAFVIAFLLQAKM